MSNRFRVSALVEQYASQGHTASDLLLEISDFLKMVDFKVQANCARIQGLGFKGYSIQPQLDHELNNFNRQMLFPDIFFENWNFKLYTNCQERQNCIKSGPMSMLRHRLTTINHHYYFAERRQLVELVCT
ncbi:hypothetical protein TNCV_310971 [Trichonephila clavipes]|nr:hypothetical protein TNCV_310971 [Trichonephila clavipes]